VNVVFQRKTDSNPESSVGIMTMAGKAPEVLVTHTRDMGQVLQVVHKASRQISGQADIPTAISIALLALKHRQNKNLRQRIVIFIGSPLDGQGTDEKSMTKLAKKLKKNNVAVDVVCFGDGIEEGESSVLKAFVDGANSSDNSHLVTAHPGGSALLSDVVISSAVLAGDGVLADAVMTDVTNAGEGPSGGEYGVDPNVDPELAMALRMSLEEEQARQAAASASTTTPQPAGALSGADSTPQLSSASSQPPAPLSTTAPAEPTDDEEEALLKQALEMSQAAGEDVEMQDHVENVWATTASSTAVSGDTEMDGMSEEEAIAQAIAMSMQTDEEKK